MKYYHFLLASFFSLSLLQGQISLDPSFGIDGITSIAVGLQNSGSSTVSLLPDGKFIVSGYGVAGLEGYDFALAKFTPEGQLDAGFADNGISLLDISGYQKSDFPYSSIVQDDGKILVVGRSNGLSSLDIVLARYLSNGQLDSLFAYNGHFTFDYQGLADRGYDVAIQADQKIVLCGYFTKDDSTSVLMAMRFHPNGLLDSTFADNGLYINDFGVSNSRAYKIEVLPNQKLIIAGRAVFDTGKDLVLLQLNPDGTPDTDFGTNGVSVIDVSNESSDVCFSFLVQEDSSFLIGGDAMINSTHFAALTKVLPDGTLDMNFGTNGIIIDTLAGIERITSIINQPDGKILVNAHSSSVNTLIRFSSNGQLDTDFGNNGVYLLPISHHLLGDALLFQPDGKLVVLGKQIIGNKQQMAMVRFITEFAVGVVDFSPVENILIYPNPILSETNFEYSLKQPEQLSLKLFDLSGKCIQTFFSNQEKKQGKHQESLRINPTIPAGNYILRLSNETGAVSVKITKG